MANLRIVEAIGYFVIALIAPIALSLFTAPFLAFECVNGAALAARPDWTSVAEFVLKLAALR